MERELTFRDAPMFARVMRDPELCRGVIESILGIEISRVEYQATEETTEPYVGGRGVRFDAYVKATGQVFDIEMQAGSEPALGRRMRYYQAAMDTALMDRGDGYDMLCESFVIFICAHDPYLRGIPAYHIERICKEDPALEVKDASHWVVLNSSAWESDDDMSRSNLLHFVESGHASDDLTEGLASAVKEANDDADWRKRAMGFMTVEHSQRVRLRAARAEGLAEGEAKGREAGLAEGRAEGEAKGSAEAEARYSKLVDALLNQNRIDDLKRAADDPEYRQTLFSELGL